VDFEAVIFFYRARLLALHPTQNLQNQVSVFMTPSDRVAQLYPQALVSLFVAFYDWQGYGGGILTRLHMGHFHHHYFILTLHQHCTVKEGKAIPVTGLEGV
jgi:hypothetical protein